MSKKILVIDDEELVTKSLLRLLKNEDYIVVVARNGSEALSRIKGDDFDLIISDVRMPQMDGIETIKEIRAYLVKSNKKLIPEAEFFCQIDLKRAA